MDIFCSKMRSCNFTQKKTREKFAMGVQGKGEHKIRLSPKSRLKGEKGHGQVTLRLPCSQTIQRSANHEWRTPTAPKQGIGPESKKGLLSGPRHASRNENPYPIAVWRPWPSASSPGRLFGMGLAAERSLVESDRIEWDSPPMTLLSGECLADMARRAVSRGR